MTEQIEARRPRPQREALSGRARDFGVLIAAFAAVMILLVLSTPLGWIEAITAVTVIGSLAAAYFVGSATFLPAQRAPAIADAPSPAPPVSAAELLRALPLPAFEVDANERIIAFNVSADTLLRLAGRTSPRAGAVIRSAPLLAAIERAVREPPEEPVQIEVESGTDETWRASVCAIPGSAHVLVILEDQTPVKRAARARADFLANASHELRTPLTALSGFIETMRGPAKDDKASWDRFLDIMAGESERMSRLIADLLSLSRIESSEQVSPRDREDLSEIISGALDALQPLAIDRGVALRLAPAGPIPLVIAHHDEMIQVVENLVSNAMKYSKSGQEVSILYGAAPSMLEARARAAQVWTGAERMTLLAATGRAVLADPAVWLRIEDNGPGIEREHLPRLGERFYRADQSRGGKITGTGLGLAIVKHIMAHHRGGLAVETRLGQGTAFGVWLPAARGGS